MQLLEVIVAGAFLSTWEVNHVPEIWIPAANSRRAPSRRPCPVIRDMQRRLHSTKRPPTTVQRPLGLRASRDPTSKLLRLMALKNGGLPGLVHRSQKEPENVLKNRGHPEVACNGQG